jgi:hypothetical protein
LAFFLANSSHYNRLHNHSEIGEPADISCVTEKGAFTMTDFSSFNVTRRLTANPPQITSKNGEVVEKKKYNMVNPHKVDEPGLMNLLNQLDFSNPDKNTKGLVRSNDSFHLTHGVLKFKPGEAPPSAEYPPSEPPIEEPSYEIEVPSYESLSESEYTPESEVIEN